MNEGRELTPLALMPSTSPAGRRRQALNELAPERWRRLVTIGVVASLVLALVGIAIGVASLSRSTTTAGTAAAPAAAPAGAFAVPATGDIISGITGFDVVPLTSHINAIYITASGGSLRGTQIAQTTKTFSGWVAMWNSASVPNGAYRMTALIYDNSGRSGHSAPIVVTVKN